MAALDGSVKPFLLLTRRNWYDLNKLLARELEGKFPVVKTHGLDYRDGTL